MKIIAVGRNYALHATELNNQPPSQPILFLKPDTAVLKNNQPFYHPIFSQNIQHEVEVVVKICKEGKYIAEKFAHKYFDEVGLGIDFTARDLQTNLKEQSLPWEIAKAFDNSAPISNFIPADSVDIQNLSFKLLINGQLKQEGNTADMLFTINQIIAYASQFFTLKKGDIIFTGTPAGVGKINIGDNLTGFLNDVKMLDFMIK